MSETSVSETPVSIIPSTPQKKSLTMRLNESDKPFILAVLSLIALVVTVLYCLYLGQWYPIYQTMWKDVAFVFSPLVMMAWAWYFKSKSE